MKEENIKLPIQSALIPVFYRNFRCLAQDCRDSCCVGWKITFDKKDYLRLRRLEAPAGLRARLEQGVRREKKGSHDGVLYGKFDLAANSGRCPFLDPDGLCAIQRACGGDALPLVCRTYPRKEGYTAAAKEYALSPSCEGVLQQLWDLPEGITFVEEPLPKSEWRRMTIAPDENLVLFFTPLRGMWIDILQNRALSLTGRFLYLGAVLQRLLKADWTSFDPDAWTQQAALGDTEAVKEMTGSIAGNRDMYLVQNIKVLDAIAAAEKTWPAELYDVLQLKRRVTVSLQPDSQTGKNARYTTDFCTNGYEEALARFQEAFADREYFFENLMVAASLHLGFPHLSGKEALWKSYVSLCSLYSFYRFVSVLGCKKEATKERLFHMLVMASRATLHSRERFDSFQEELFQHDSSTLAHMAILLKG